MSERELIIGLGNEMRGDDAAGLRVAELVAEGGIETARCAGEPLELLELWRGAEAALVVDAVAGSKPGRVWRFECQAGGLPAIFAERTSTHLIGLADVVEIGRELDRLPARLTVIGIEGERFALGSEPSAAVESAVECVAAAIRAGRRGIGIVSGSVLSTVPGSC